MSVPLTRGTTGGCQKQTFKQKLLLWDSTDSGYEKEVEV